MTFPLVRLPLLTLREVIKSMNIREIVLFPSLSKKCHQIVKTSISKKSSLKIAFTPRRNFIVIVIISPNVQSDVMWNGQERSCSLKIGDNRFVTARSSTCDNRMNFSLNTTGYLPYDEELIKSVLRYFIDTFKPLVKFDFNFEIRHEFAMELIRYCRQQCIQLSCNEFECRDSESPEEVRGILEDCLEENGKLCIYSSLPEIFEYTPPPGGFKLQSLLVTNAHWVNLNDFLQCEDVKLYGDLHHMTPAYLNNVFKTIVNTECEIKWLELHSKTFFLHSFPELIRGLTDRPIRDNRVSKRVDFEGNDGLTTTIIHYNLSIILTRK
ncbi:unnamed protein product [Caenorhabditis brenneri]